MTHLVNPVGGVPMSKIVFIAPSEEMVRIGYEILPEFNEEIDIRMGFMDYAVNVAKVLDKESVDVIITRGGTASLMKNAGIKTPIVEVPITGKEVVTAIKRAEEAVEKARPVIGYIGFENMVRTIGMFTDILDVDLKIYELKSMEDIEQKVLEAKTDHIDVIIGGILTTEYASRHNVPSVMLEATKDSLREAFKIAGEMKYARTLEKKKAKELKVILDSAFEAIIGVDEKGRITVFNTGAELFFKVKASKALGEKFTDIVNILDENVVNKVLVEGQQILGNIVKMNDISIVLNFTPVIVDQKLMAAILSFQEIDKIQNMETKIRKELYLKGNTAEYTFKDIQGRSDAIEETKRVAESFSKLDSIVLIVGETGTGKELFAQSIHNTSLRSQGPFVAVNCGAIPSNLLESELFGYAEGAFTGARKGGKQGLFEIAHRGTIFLDEISEMDIYGQVMLLRVIQEKQIRRVGDDRVIPVDVRIIAATNKNLLALVEEKKFREDLYYRLNVLTLNIPPLRDRHKDVEFLLQYYIGEYSRKFYKYVELTEDAVDIIRRYPWYGNVRQLKSFCERLVAIAYQSRLDGEFIKKQLENKLTAPRAGDEGISKRTAVHPSHPLKAVAVPGEEDLTQRILELLDKHKGSKSKVAEELGISRTTLWRQMKKANIICGFGRAER